MASRFFFSIEHISYYIRNFKILSILVYARCVRSGSSYIYFLKISKRCAICVGILQKCKFFFWSVLKRQKAKLDIYLKRKMALKKNFFDKIIKYRAQIEWLRRIIKLNRLRLFTKMVNKLEKQNKKIKKQITRKSLIEGER